jgi:UDP-N-acetylglucosamine 2-epimerase (hydrolysing)
MHMLSRYGSTFDEVRKRGFRNIFYYINQVETNSFEMDMALASTIEGLSRFIREFKIDLIVVHGDRVEALAGAIVGALNDILVAHIEGGEVSGTVDELIRHSVTKLSHLHFVSNDEARKRLIQMGEDQNSVFVIGSPETDVMLSAKLPSIQDVRAKYEIPFDEYGIFVYHPVTSELRHLRNSISEMLRAVIDSALNYVVILPNNDRGSETILESIRKLDGHPRFRILPSMRFEYFLALLKDARFIVGNSSAGVREAPVYGVPTINVGSRQRRRTANGTIRNVAERYDEIRKALSDIPGNVPRTLDFGNGSSAQAFIRLLKGKKIWTTPTQKHFNDLSFPS